MVDEIGWNKHLESFFEGKSPSRFSQSQESVKKDDCTADAKKISDETRDPRTEPVNGSTKDGTVDWRETEKVPEPPIAPWKIGAIYQKLSLSNFIH